MKSPRHGRVLRGKADFAAVVLLALMAWQSVGLHVLHPLLHRHGTHCGEHYDGTHGDIQDVMIGAAAPFHGPHDFPPALCGSCPICTSTMVTTTWMLLPISGGVALLTGDSSRLCPPIAAPRGMPRRVCSARAPPAATQSA